MELARQRQLPRGFWMRADARLAPLTFRPLGAQAGALTKRCLADLVRRRVHLVGTVIGCLLAGLLIGFLYFRDRSVQLAVRARDVGGCLFLCAAAAMLAVPLSTAVNHPRELGVFARERRNHMHTAFASSIATFVSGFPVHAVYALCLAAPSYWLAGLADNAWGFLFHCLVTWLAIDAGAALGTLAACLAGSGGAAGVDQHDYALNKNGHQNKAHGIAAGLCFALVAVGGGVLAAPSLAWYVEWLRALSPARHAFDAMVRTQDGIAAGAGLCAVLGNGCAGATTDRGWSAIAIFAIDIALRVLALVANIAVG
jgi:hypothetical protein